MPAATQRTSPTTKKRKPGRPKGTIKTGGGHPRGKVADPMRGRDPLRDPAPKSAAGRPTLLTPEVQEKLTGYLRMGAYFVTACNALGIDPDTAEEWVRRGIGTGPVGRAGLTRYQEFATVVRKAQAEGELLLQGRVLAGKTGWQGAWSIMGVKFPSRWRVRETPTRLEVDLVPRRAEVRAERIDEGAESPRQLLEHCMLALTVASQVAPPTRGVDPAGSGEPDDDPTEP